MAKPLEEHSSISDSPEPKAGAFPRHVAVIGAAGGLGQGILAECREAGAGFTAIVRSRPERIEDIPAGSRVEVVPSLGDHKALVNAFTGADAVISAAGVTATSRDRTALMSLHLTTLASAMIEAGVDRIVLVNTVVAPRPGEPPGWAVRLFAALPGTWGLHMREIRDIGNAIAAGALSSVRWTLVRAAVNSHGIDIPAVACAEWDRTVNSMLPVCYRSMGRWMLEEAVADRFVNAAPVVTRPRRR